MILWSAKCFWKVGWPNFEISMERSSENYFWVKLNEATFDVLNTSRVVVILLRAWGDSRPP